MSALDNQVQNQNFLSPLNFAFHIKRAPGITWGCQEVTIPGMQLNSPAEPNPFVKIPQPGDQLTFDDLQMTFRVDEDLVNYLEIFNWMTALGFPENFDQYAALAKKPKIQNDGIRSELVLHLLKSNRLVNYEIQFHDAFPVSLSDMILTTKDTEVSYVECTAIFRYSYFELVKLS